LGYYLTQHNDLYDGFTLKNQSGGYIKLGTYLNLRRTTEKKGYFLWGIFVTNSWVNEKGLYLTPASSKPYSYAVPSEHTVYLVGLSSSVGYELSLSERLKTNIDFQISIPNHNSRDLYSYVNFIPGMELNGNVKGKLFPMLLWNVKYRL